MPALLSESDLPDPDDAAAVFAFAMSFDGYKYYGSLEKSSAVAKQKSRETLAELRNELFFAARISTCRFEQVPGDLSGTPPAISGAASTVTCDEQKKETDLWGADENDDSLPCAVMVKPLGEAGLGEYLDLVSRDHPDAS
ncbi:hypothetical protein PQR36_01415 [Paraburkholderia nemoris]|uniref:hypothetical protein n=1 Tax=Paraburkholderia nemoris TaxID=2793076 RepID=UPI0038BC2CED